jgi:hypothetical protein
MRCAIGRTEVMIPKVPVFWAARSAPGLASSSLDGGLAAVDQCRGHELCTSSICVVDVAPLLLLACSPLGVYLIFVLPILAWVCLLFCFD